jgi:hypothetical protein
MKANTQCSFSQSNVLNLLILIQPLLFAVGIHLWIRSILLWKPESLQVAKVDATDKTLEEIFYEHTMYVISLSNISIKAHNTTFQTNNKVRIKIKKFVE